MSTIINATTTNGVVIEPDNSGSLELQTNSGTTALTIDTSQRAAFVAGTAAAPAITTTGDTNTGMFFPAADTIAFSEGGAESMRINSDSNLSVGTTGSSARLTVTSATANSSTKVIQLNNSSGTELLAIVSDGAFYTGSAAASPNNSTTAAGANTVLASFGQLLRSTSALKYKQDIRDLEYIDLNKFRPVRYKSKCKNDDQSADYIGFIADEVDAIGLKELVSYGDNGEVEGFQYERMTAILCKAIQEQQTIINDLKARIETLEAK